MDYKEANRTIASYNAYCENEKDYKKVYAYDLSDEEEIVPIKFFDNGSVLTVKGYFYDKWKPIEDETPSEQETELWNGLPKPKEWKATQRTKHIEEYPPKPQTESDILRRAKEICFKTGYVRRKDHGKNTFQFVEGMNFGLFLICRIVISAKEIVEEWESIDPMED